MNTDKTLLPQIYQITRIPKILKPQKNDDPHPGPNEKKLSVLCALCVKMVFLKISEY